MVEKIRIKKERVIREVDHPPTMEKTKNIAKAEAVEARVEAKV